LRFESFGDAWHLFQLGAAAIRRETFEKVGLLDESMRSAEDLDWFLRARETGISLTLNPRVVLHYRLHGANISRQKAWRDAHLAAAFKKSLDRRRQREEGLSPLPAWFAVDGREAKSS
jgi:GT2 family glycosyltransferase